jgi:hypothetical protein
VATISPSDVSLPLEERWRRLRRRRRAIAPRILALAATAAGVFCAFLIGIGLFGH